MEKHTYEIVNVEEGLKMIGGYKQIYKKLIQTFLDNQKNLVGEVKDTLAHDLSEARRLVHSCKGISLNLGASKLYDVTKDLELAILNEEQHLIGEHMEDFEVVFNKAYNELHMIESHI